MEVRKVTLQRVLVLSLIKAKLLSAKAAQIRSGFRREEWVLETDTTAANRRDNKATLDSTLALQPSVLAFFSISKPVEVHRCACFLQG